MRETGRRKLLYQTGALPHTAVFILGLIGSVTAIVSENHRSAFMAIFQPWWCDPRSQNTADQAGIVRAETTLPFRLPVGSQKAHLANGLRAAGALLMLDLLHTMVRPSARKKGRSSVTSGLSMHNSVALRLVLLTMRLQRLVLPAACLARLVSLSSLLRTTLLIAARRGSRPVEAVTRRLSIGCMDVSA